MRPPPVQPHVDSFDYFLGEGMERVVDGLEGVEVGVSPAWDLGHALC